MYEATQTARLNQEDGLVIAIEDIVTDSDATEQYIIKCVLYAFWIWAVQVCVFALGPGWYDMEEEMSRCAVMRITPSLSYTT